MKEPTPTTVPVAPLKERTPILERTLPARCSPVEMEVVPSWPEEFKKAMVEVAKENMVELLNVAVELKVAPPAKVTVPVTFRLPPSKRLPLASKYARRLLDDE